MVFNAVADSFRLGILGGELGIIVLFSIQARTVCMDGGDVKVLSRRAIICIVTLFTFNITDLVHCDRG